MKKIFKYASYALLYVVITFASAFGIVLLLPTPTSNNSNDQNQTVTIPTQLTEMITQLTEANGINIYLMADIESGDDDYIFIVNALADFQDGFENMTVDGTISVIIENQMFDIDINYNRGTLYFELLKGKFKIETANIMESITQVLDILKIEFPDLGIDFSQLDINTILGFLSNLTETKGDYSISINIDIPMLGELTIDCNLDYAINKVILPKTQINPDTSISLTSKLYYPDYIDIETPETEEYVNLSDIFLITESVLSTVDQNEIGMDIQFEIENHIFNGFLSANLKEFNSKLIIENILGYNLNLIAIDDVIYLEFGNINLCYDLKKSNLITNLIEKHFGIKIPLDEISQLLVAINDGKLFETIGTLFPKENKIDFNSIDLSIINNFNRQDDRYTLSIRGIGDISFVIKEKVLEEISFLGFGINAKVSLTTPQSIELDNDIDSYINLEEIIPGLDAIFATTKFTTFDGLISIGINNQTYLAQYSLSLDKNERIIKINATINDIPLVIVGDKDGIFIQIANMKFKVNLNDIENLIEIVSRYFDIDINRFIEILIEQVKNFLNPNIYPSLISSIKAENNSLKISLLKDIDLILIYNETITDILVSSKDFNLTLSINAKNQAFGEIGIDKDEFIGLDEILPFADIMFEYLSRKHYQFDFKLELFENEQSMIKIDNANILLDITDKVKLIAQIQLSEQIKIIATVNGNEILIKLGTIEIPLNLKDKEVIEMIKSLGLDDATIAMIQNILDGRFNEIDFDKISLPSINDLLTNLNAIKNIEIEENTLSVYLNLFGKQGKISIITDGEKLISINIENLSVDENLTLNLSLQFNTL